MNYSIPTTAELLAHEAHLPETISCICGYDREDAERYAAEAAAR